MGWLLLALVVLARIVYSPKGRAWRAVREDTIAAQAIGIDVLPTRLSAFVIGAFFAGAGGSLYGHYLGSFSPAGFYFAYTFSLISMLVIGGMQSMTGAVVGVIVVSLLSELLRNLERGFRPWHRRRSASLWGEPDRPRDHLHLDHDLPSERCYGRSRVVVRTDCRIASQRPKGMNT